MYTYLKHVSLHGDNLLSWIVDALVNLAIGAFPQLRDLSVFTQLGLTQLDGILILTMDSVGVLIHSKRLGCVYL